MNRRLSHYQYGTLKFIESHVVTMLALRRAHQGTLGSLLERKLIQRREVRQGSLIELTDAGRDLLTEYRFARENTRNFESDPSIRVARLLHLVKLINKRRAS